MSRFVPLELKMHDGRPLPHTFFEGEGAGLLIVLPGLHYGSDGPVLYHLAKQVQTAGWDTLGLMYGFQASVAVPWTDHVAEILAECEAAAGEAMGRRAYPLLGFVGKSLGSIVLAQLCAQGAVPDEALAAYLTPPMGNSLFDSTFAATRQPAYVAVGTADSFYSDQAVAGLRAGRPVLIRVIEGADHGLDVPGDLASTLRAVGQVVEDTSSFFLTGEIPGLEGAARP
jgi:predicted alpha/beta-hydrolase family hydrolase